MNPNLSSSIAGIERQIEQKKTELADCHRRVTLAYEYKDAIYPRLQFADKQIQEAQEAVFSKQNEINSLLESIKDLVKTYEKEIV